MSFFLSYCLIVRVFVVFFRRYMNRHTHVYSQPHISLTCGELSHITVRLTNYNTDCVRFINPHFCFSVTGQMKCLHKLRAFINLLLGIFCDIQLFVVKINFQFKSYIFGNWQYIWTNRIFIYYFFLFELQVDIVYVCVHSKYHPINFLCVIINN